MALGLVTVGHRSEFGAFGPAACFGDRTSWVEGATTRGMDGRGEVRTGRTLVAKAGIEIDIHR